MARKWSKEEKEVAVRNLKEIFAKDKDVVHDVYCHLCRIMPGGRAAIVEILIPADGKLCFNSNTRTKLHICDISYQVAAALNLPFPSYGVKIRIEGGKEKLHYYLNKNFQQDLSEVLGLQMNFFQI